MSSERSLLSRKLLGKFLIRYTCIALIISVLVLIVTAWLYSRYAGNTARQHMAMAADALTDYQTDIQEDALYLLSDSSLTQSIGDFCRTGTAGALSAVNLRLRSIRTSDADLLFVMMDDLEGNLFHSLASGSGEILSFLRKQEGYSRLKDRNTSEFSPVFSRTDPDSAPAESASRIFLQDTDHICVYYTRHTIDGKSFLVTMVFDADPLVERTASACEPLDSYCLFSNRDVPLYSSGLLPELLPQELNGMAKTGGMLTRNGYYFLQNNYSAYAVGCISMRSILSRFLATFLLFLLICLVPVLLSAFSLYPAAEKLLHPIYDLNRQVQRFSIGKPPVEAIATGDEIEGLSNSIRSMSEGINQQALEISEKEREKALTYYKLLTTQLDPHFIYNTMNIINILARRKAYEDIILVNTALTRVLRERLNTQNTTFSPVQEEIGTLKQYLLIMDYRYHHRVQVDFNVDDGVLSVLIPKNILQPIVENSYYHGLTRENGEIAGSISLFIYPDSGELILEIADDGEGMEQSRLDELKAQEYSLNIPGSRHSHIGIENIYRRLQYLYGTGFSFDIQSTLGSGTTVVITIPLLKEMPENGRTAPEASGRPAPDSPI